MTYKEVIHNLPYKPCASQGDRLVLFATAGKTPVDGNAYIPYPRIVCLPIGLDGNEYLIVIQRCFLKPEKYYVTDFENLDEEQRLWDERLKIKSKNPRCTDSFALAENERRNEAYARKMYYAVYNERHERENREHYYEEVFPFTMENVINTVNKLTGTKFTTAEIKPPIHLIRKEERP